MENQEHRRKFRRHPMRWKAAVVFDKADGKPLLHTQTHDLSVGGTSIHSNYGDLTGTHVTLLLAQPARQGHGEPKMLKIRAQVVSSVHSPDVPGFRHGLKFEPSKDDGLDVLAGILGAAETSSPGAGQAAPTPLLPAAAPEGRAASSGGMLAQLRQAALAKQQEEHKTDSTEQKISRVSEAVEKMYRYLKEFAGQLDLVKPAYAREYAIAGVPKFDGLKWASAWCDFHARVTSPTTKVFEQVTLSYLLSAEKKLSVTRETPSDERLKQMLLDTKIEFTARQENNARGSPVRTTFDIPCEVSGSLVIMGNFNTGKLMLKARNVESFGTLEHVLDPGAISEESLNELAQFILGESRRLGPLLLKGA